MKSLATLAVILASTLVACGGPPRIPSATLYGESDYPGFGTNQKQVFERRNVDSGQTREIYGVPANSHFVLTLFCSDSDDMELHVGIPEVGLVLTGDGCTTFYPGLHLVEAQNIRCTNPADEVHACQIAGVETW